MNNDLVVQLLPRRSVNLPHELQCMFQFEIESPCPLASPDLCSSPLPQEKTVGNATLWRCIALTAWLSSALSTSLVLSSLSSICEETKNASPRPPKKRSAVVITEDETILVRTFSSNSRRSMTCR
eukprot:759124-Hanusia_phi.AAC.2